MYKSVKNNHQECSLYFRFPDTQGQIEFLTSVLGTCHETVQLHGHPMKPVSILIHMFQYLC